MKFPSPLVKALLIRRYKRFLADVRLEDGSIITVHCPNPGSMTGISDPGLTAWISRSDNRRRKLSHTLELIQLPGHKEKLTGVNASLANRIAEEAILSDRFPEFGEFDQLRREVQYGKNSRVDIILSAKNSPDVYVEVKSVTLSRRSDLCEFPDSVTKRGRKHLNELAEIVENGGRAIMLYLVQRSDSDKFSFSCARDIDPLYAKAFDAAIARGVEVIAIQCKISIEEIIADKIIEINERAARQAK